MLQYVIPILAGCSFTFAYGQVDETSSRFADPAINGLLHPELLLLSLNQITEYSENIMFYMKFKFWGVDIHFPIKYITFHSSLDYAKHAC